MSHTNDLADAMPGFLPRLWRFGLYLARNREDAEDLVQRTCVRALERQHQFIPGTSQLTWMYSIMQSVWLNELRARQIRSRASIEWQDETIENVVAASDSTNPEEITYYLEILEFVNKLPDAQRVVMLLVVGEGLSYQETADALGIPIGTVMSRLARARLTIGSRFNGRTAAGRQSAGPVEDLRGG